MFLFHTLSLHAVSNHSDLHYNIRLKDLHLILFALSYYIMFKLILYVVSCILYYVYCILLQLSQQDITIVGYDTQSALFGVAQSAEIFE